MMVVGDKLLIINLYCMFDYVLCTSCWKLLMKKR